MVKDNPKLIRLRAGVEEAVIIGQTKASFCKNYLFQGAFVLVLHNCFARKLFVFYY